MSKYSLSFEPAQDDRQAEWLVCREQYTVNQVTISQIVFSSTSREEAECMLEEFLIIEQGNEYDLYLNQVSEYDYV